MSYKELQQVSNCNRIINFKATKNSKWFRVKKMRQTMSLKAVPPAAINLTDHFII